MTDAFFSRSKSLEMRNLSNFAPSARPIVVAAELSTAAGVAPIDGQFTCVEGVYQAYKYHIGCCRGTDAVKQAMVRAMQDGGDAHKGIDAKRAGSAKAMAQQECTLDVKEKWTLDIQKRVMKMAIRARCLVDAVYASKLDDARAGDFVWFHTERPKRGQTPYWGGYRSKATGERVGLNVLGVLMREVADERFAATAAAAVRLRPVHPRPDCRPSICRYNPLLHLNHVVEDVVRDMNKTIKWYRGAWDEPNADRKDILASYAEFVHIKRDWEVDGPMIGTDGLDDDVVDAHRQAKKYMLETEAMFKQTAATAAK